MSASHCSALPATLRPDTRPTAGAWAQHLFDRIRAATALRRQRQALLRLDEALLRDIGITRCEAESEAKTPFWDAPTHWRG